MDRRVIDAPVPIIARVDERGYKMADFYDNLNPQMEPLGSWELAKYVGWVLIDSIPELQDVFNPVILGVVERNGVVCVTTAYGDITDRALAHHQVSARCPWSNATPPQTEELFVRKSRWQQ
jgi:hypothetical protein